MCMALAACSSEDSCLIMLCTNQTHMQMGYETDRDQCRGLSEMKVGMLGGNEDQDQKSKLIASFNECMAAKGWSIGSDGDKKAAAAAATSTPNSQTTEPIATPPDAAPEERTRRMSECSFARQEAEHSFVAKQRAEACDLECDSQRRAAPEAPKPASCR